MGSPAGGSPDPPPDAPRRPPALVVTVVVVAPGNLAALHARMRRLVEAGVGVIVCDVGGVVAPGAHTVDALARLQLAARRLGCRLRLKHSSHALRELLVLTGLADVLADDGDPLRVEAGGQPEEGEQRRGVEEEVPPDDAAV